MIPVVLGIVGLVLIYAEFFLPGGIVGGIGGLVLIASYIMLAVDLSDPVWIVISLIIYLLVLAGTIWLALHFVKKRKDLFLTDDQEGYVASAYDKELVGKFGVAYSNLSLSGRVTIEGKNYQAISQSQFIHRGSEVEVIGGRGAYLIVRPKENHS
ncbi:MAG: NfeD family protein [Simkaniaceae bacterium]|nr:NfeD family protein [Simkaniaceae bacterium]